MASAQSSKGVARVEVENVGGIDETAVEFSPGVSILAGRNATNRTSLLRAIMGALGSDDISLKADADEGAVSLTLDDETYTRTLERTGGNVVTSGDPYLDDPEIANLFAFLLESNEARQGVARGDDLRELIMRPVDTEAIQSEIERLEARKRELDEQLSDLETLESELPGLERERVELTERIDEKRDELAEKESEIAELDATLTESQESNSERETKLDELRTTRSALEDVRFDIETEKESIEAVREDREELTEERASLDSVPDERLEEVDAEIGRLRDRIESIDSTVSDLQAVIQFNEDLLDGEGASLSEALNGRDAETNGSVTDRLVDDTVVCWTCGSEVESNQVASTLEHLQTYHREKLDRRNELREEIDELEAERRALQERKRRREEIERELDELETELTGRQESLEELESKRSELVDEVGDLEEEVKRVQSDDQDEVLALHREANELEFEVERLESERDDLEDEIEAVESRLADREELAEERTSVQSELVDLRTRIEQIETDAIEAFNEHMNAVLDILDYGNLERIWLERTERKTHEGRRKVAKTAFELHIIRSTESDATYEDTIEHLSESEREVTGLVFALAGYLVHRVYETVPFMLLDSLEAVDSERIAALVEYLSDYPDFLVVALLPEDAAAVDEEYPRVSSI